MEDQIQDGRDALVIQRKHGFLARFAATLGGYILDAMEGREVISMEQHTRRVRGLIGANTTYVIAYRELSRCLEEERRRIDAIKELELVPR